MKFFTLLNRRQAYRSLAKSKEFNFFLKHRSLLLHVNSFRHFFNLEDEFTLVRANILLRGLLNKKRIEEFLSMLGEQSMQQFKRIKHHWIRDEFTQTFKADFHFHIDNQIAYLPFFNRAMNYIYAYEPDKLFDYPYQKLIEAIEPGLVDPFDTYGYTLYQSSLSPLIDLCLQDSSSRAFFHPDYKMIFMINNQGRLDVKISLFDRHLKRANETDVEARIKRCLPHYFSHQKEAFIKSLYDEGLISQRLYQTLKPNVSLSFIQRENE